MKKFALVKTKKTQCWFCQGTGRVFEKNVVNPISKRSIWLGICTHCIGQLHYEATSRDELLRRLKEPEIGENRNEFKPPFDYTIEELSKIYQKGRGGRGYEANLAYCLRETYLYIQKIEEKLKRYEKRL